CSVRRNGAGDRIRTGDINLGKVALYQLSYSREANCRITRGERHYCRARERDCQTACKITSEGWNSHAPASLPNVNSVAGAQSQPFQADRVSDKPFKAKEKKMITGA